MQKYILSVVVLFSNLIFLPINSYATRAAEYEATIENTLPMTVEVNTENWNCIDWVQINGNTVKRTDSDSKKSDLILTIPPKSSSKITFKSLDDNDKISRSCYGGTCITDYEYKCKDEYKKLTFKMHPYIPQSQMETYSTYDMYVRFRHRNKNDGESRFQDDTKSETGQNSELLLEKSICVSYTGLNKSCLDTWASKTKKKDRAIVPLYFKIGGGSEETMYHYSMSSVALGDVTVKDGLGGIVEPDPITKQVELKYKDEKYYVSFSRSTAKCTLKEGMLKCPTSIDFLRKESNIIFLCAQTEHNHSHCPWTKLS
ncbi:hypothetical protein L3V83_02410 [Thiotrichales bacterium 19X7-9]|nr:hypothetical protein [Thiotrichales bacterium 19X7-9]